MKASFQRVSDNNKHHKNIPRIHVLWDGCRWNKSMKNHIQHNETATAVTATTIESVGWL
jgi:hypothetical protein